MSKMTAEEEEEYFDNSFRLFLFQQDTYNVALYPEVAVTEKVHTRAQIFVYNEVNKCSDF